MRLRSWKIVFASSLIALHCSSTAVRDDAKFSYENIYQDRYLRGTGGIIPITIERGESYSGTITGDNRYLYFSSNSSGNYDLYLRDLNDVFSIPIVQTVTNQREPTISPDGKYLAYVDDELDPDGDIILLKVNPKKLIELYRERREPDDEWFASKPKNLTNSEGKRIRARDVNPAWSPDGKWLAYSSDLDPQKADDLGAGAGAVQNIWLMPVGDSAAKRMLTQKGGVMPSFSTDGKKIVYVSYEDPNSLGAVYEIEIASGISRRITSGKSLDFYPSYAPEDDGIVLTRIATDSNGDGYVDRKDAGQIIRIYPDADTMDVVADDDLVPLTSRKDHVFDSRVSGFVGGSIVHAQVKGDDINVAFIPLSGAVPVKPDVRQQIAYLQTLVDGAKFKQGYCSGLHQLPAAFSHSPDVIVYTALSEIRRTRCDKVFAEKFAAQLAEADAEDLALYALFNDLSQFVPHYADLKGAIRLDPLAETKNVEDYFEAVIADKKTWRSYRDEEGNEDYKAILAFLRHEQALYFARQGKTKDARETVQKIIRQNPNYLALDELLLEICKVDSTTLPATDLIYLVTEKPDASLVEAYARSEKKGALTIAVRPHVRRAGEKFLLALFEKQFSTGNQDAVVQFLKGYPQNRYPVMNALYALAEARDQANEELYAESTEAALRVRPLVPPGSLFQLQAELTRGGNAEVKEGADAAIQIYSAAITAHRDAETPEELREIIQKVASYYKSRAETFTSQGNDRQAAKEYEALLELCLNAHANRLAKELPKGDLLEFALRLDQIAVRASGTDKELLEDILNFYDNRIDVARRYLVTEFLFGRGFLRAQLGIARHQAAEADGITKSEKQQVFEDFRKAEVDLNWCFFTNPQFADSYVMLGWIYQYIDEKREVVLDTTSGKKDREVFESLYKKFFPDFLFEKNIQLYQKSLALFGTSASPRVKNSFHLNIANNYFLLNNYGQAEIHYSAMLDVRGNPDFRFESNEQEFMFYYHYGRTLYFTGKHEEATRYLKFVENNLNTRYPLQNQSASVQKVNQTRRETAYKVLALNSEYEQNLQTAVAHNSAIESERKIVGAESPVSMVYLELARLNLRLGDLNAALHYTNEAEEALGREKEIKPPKYRFRVKWFWIYEPWTTMFGWIYKWSADDVFIGDNHIGFELPTVNRYQLLHSIRSDILKNKGLLHEASASLGLLIEYAKKDNGTSHGKETESAAVSRRAEIEFQMKNWDEAQKLYEIALGKAEKAKNAPGELLFRKNIALAKLRKLESEPGPIADKTRLARQYHDEIAAFEEKTINARIAANRKAVKEREDPTKKDLSESEILTIKQTVKAELKPLLYFKPLFLAHETELVDFQDRLAVHTEDFDQFLIRKRAHFDRFADTLKYFRGYSRESFAEVHEDFEPDLRNNSLRLKLAMNRAKLLQEMNLFDEAVAEFRTVQEKSQEFRANLEYAISSYRAYRLYEEVEAEDTVSIDTYQNIVRYFRKNQSFLRANTDLFERLSNILIERALQKNNYVEAIQLEDQKRQLLGLQLYFDDLKFKGPKEESFQRLLIAEERRVQLQAQIRSARLGKTSAPQQEKELAGLDDKVGSLRNLLSQGDRLDYRYETFFTEGFSPAEAQDVVSQGLIYVLRPRDALVAVYAKSLPGAKNWSYETIAFDREKDLKTELESFAQKTGARVLIMHPQIMPTCISSDALRQLSLQTTLRAQINFSHNPERARRNVLQLTKSRSLFSFGGGNEADYSGFPALKRVKKSQEVESLPQHSNVVDYEAELGRKTTLVDNASINPAHLYHLNGNPNYAIASRDSRLPLATADEFRFMTSADLYFSAMGAGQVLYTMTKRSVARLQIEGFLTGGLVPPTMISTGNPAPAETRAAGVTPNWLLNQKKSYLRKIESARRLHEYGEAYTYAEDGLSLLPGDIDLLAAAAEIKYLQRDPGNGSGLLRQIPSDPAQPLARRREYARLLLRSGDIAAFDAYVTKDAALKADLNKTSADFEAYVQLAAFETGDLAPLTKPFVWLSPGNPKARKRKNKTISFTREISPELKNDSLRNDVCSAALHALEYVLVIKSCGSAKAATAAERLERERARDFFAPTKKDANRPLTGDDLDFIRAYSLIRSGFVADSLPVAQGVLREARLTFAEQLLVFSYLHVLAERKVNQADSRGVSDLISNYARLASGKAHNAQARRFYEMVALLPSVVSGGEAAIVAANTEPATSGMISAANLLRLYAITIKPTVNESILATSTLPVDNRIESDLAFYAATSKSYPDSVDCLRSNCSLTVKRNLAQGEAESAVYLILRGQNAIKKREQLKLMPTGAYGFGELFEGEVLAWHFDGAKFLITPISDFSQQLLDEFGKNRKYLLVPAAKNPLGKRKLIEPRDVVLFILPEKNFERLQEGRPVVLGGRADTLLSSLLAVWGRGPSKQAGEKLNILVKGTPGAGTAQLHIYSSPVELQTLASIKERGYHLFAAPSESPSGYVNFVGSVAENLIKGKMPVEEAYFAGFKGLKKAKQNDRPRYFLFRN